jgi:hypothetical protein
MTAGRSHNGCVRYDQCPNCAAEGSVRRVYQCEAGHLFCERCSTPQHTKLLRIRIDTCPTCGEHTYKFVGSTKWLETQKGHQRRTPRPTSPQKPVRVHEAVEGRHR